MIMLLQKNDGSKTTLTYNIINAENGKSIDIPCNIWGEISEKRVEELEKIKIDSSSKKITIPNGNLYVFNEIAYRIQPYDKLKLEVIEIAKILVKGYAKYFINIYPYNPITSQIVSKIYSLPIPKSNHNFSYLDFL